MINAGKRTRGFTLVELLAVVVVLAIIAVFLFPFVTSSIDRANGTKCAGNLRQLGAASAAYATDNNGFLPVGYQTTSNGSAFTGANGEYWYYLIAPYVNVPRWDTIGSYLGPQGGAINRPCIFTCPSHGKNEVNPIVYPSRYPVSYAPPSEIKAAMQSGSFVLVDESKTVWGLRVIDVNQPNKKVWLSDSTFRNINSVGAGRWTNPDDKEAWARVAFSRHDGAGNALFFDGHLERITCASVMTGNLTQNIKSLFDPTAEIK